MRWLIVLVAGCVPYETSVETVPQAQMIDGVDATTCHLAPVYQGKLAWAGITDLTDVECTSKNDVGPTREVCYQPYVGVRETGAVYTSHVEVCTNMLVEGEAETMSVRLDMRRELCRLERGGCIVRAISTRPDSPSAGAIVTFARALEAQAPQPGRDRPTVSECDGLADRFEVSDRDAMIASCLGLSRVELACLQIAGGASSANACVPRVP
jgi:hypothetical protein